MTLDFGGGGEGALKMLQHFCGTMGTPSIHLRVPKKQGYSTWNLTLVFLVETNLCENSSTCMDVLDVCFVIFLCVCVCGRVCVCDYAHVCPHSRDFPPPFPHTLSKNLRALLAEFDPKCLKLSFWNVIWGRKGVSLPFSSGFSKPKGTFHGF